MFCHKCGAENDDNAKFCRKCGAKLIKIDKPVESDNSNFLTSLPVIILIIIAVLAIISLFFILNPS